MEAARHTGLAQHLETKAVLVVTAGIQLMTRRIGLPGDKSSFGGHSWDTTDARTWAGICQVRLELEI